MSRGSNISGAAGEVSLAKYMNWASHWSSLKAASSAVLQSISFFGILDRFVMARGSSDILSLLCLTQPNRQDAESVGLIVTFSSSIRFFLLRSLSIFLFFKKKQPNIVQGRLVISAVCPLGCARSGRGVQESRGRSWIDRRARYLHSADPAGISSRQGGVRDVLFILYIIVVVDFHLDTTNTLLFSPASLGRA